MMTPDTRPDPQQMTREALVEEVKTARRIQEDARLHLLCDVGELLATPLHHRDTLSALTRLIVPSLADLCFVDVVDDEGRARRLAATFANPDKQLELAERLKTPQPPAASPQARVIATRRPECTDVVTPATLESMAPDDESAEAMRRAGITSMMVVPLMARGRMLGALTFAVTESGRRYTLDDLKFAEEIGHRAAMHVDNARLIDLHQRGVELVEQAQRV